ncbi:MAG: o-succinylbenzoate--CoA ligase, partial [Candidatus Binatia bacterium]
MAEPLAESCGPWLAERARLDADAPALTSATGTLSWRALSERVETLADRLTALGVARGDRVVVVLGTCVRLVELVHAAQRCVATLVLLDPRLAASEVAVLLAHADPVLVLHDRPFPVAAPTAQARVVGVHNTLDAVVPVRAPAPTLVDPTAVQTILYTSGTTGRPKGVMLTHANQRASAAASRAHLGVRADDRWLVALPLNHVGGLSIVMRSVLDGTPLVLHERFDAAAVWQAIDDERITLLSIVPTMLHRLLEHADGAARGTSLRAVLVGGAALAPALAERARAVGLPILPTYGLTETGSQVATSALDGSATDAATTVGRPLGTTRVRIDDADDEGRGEIVVAGPTVMAGYFRDPEATAYVLRDGWLHTGDIGRLDAAGCLQVFDRRTDVVISGGENVYPAEVEAVLLAHPAVGEAAVYGAPDPEWGRRVQAAVVLRDGAAVDAAT